MNNYRSLLKRLLKWLIRSTSSVWLFPTLVLIVFLLLVNFRVSGSSIGIYTQIIKGESKDVNLLLGEPRSIRSDEWLVTTQMIIAQNEAGFPAVNSNIGNGQDMDILLDVPAKDWSQVFRPQNHAFFVLPFDQAFAYRWWFMAAVLAIGAYFFVIFFFPNRRLLASTMAIALLFSSFLQWWYISTTLACLALPILIALVYMNLIRSDKTLTKTLLAIAMTYLMICFAILLYPPFQVPSALALAFLLLGYTLYKYPPNRFLRGLRNNLPFLLGTLVVTGLSLGLYVYQNRNTINIIQNTDYPGKRISVSGGYSLRHLLSGQLAFQQQRTARAVNYQDASAGAVNQSESSTFIFTSFFLIPPLIYLLGLSIKQKRRPYGLPFLVMLGIAYILFFSWLFIPGLSLLGTITKLDLVPVNRLIIGLGLLNFFGLTLFMYIYSKSGIHLTRMASVVFSAIALLIVLTTHLSIQGVMPMFIGLALAITLAIPLPIVIYFILRRKFTHGMIILAMFSVLSSGFVNPLYIGLGTVENNPLLSNIRQYPNDGVWIVEDIAFENIALMAGKQSLSGVFAYPQNNIWKIIDGGVSRVKYNRYAHVSYNIDRNQATQVKTGFVDTGPDQLVIKTEACSDFVKFSNIKYLVSSGKINSKDQSCISKIETVPILEDNKVYYIYTFEF